MKRPNRPTYLNGILTVTAVLLGANLWVNVADRPVFSQEVHAQDPRGIPNAAQQRKDMIDILREMSRKMDATNKALESGKMKVEIANVAELRKPTEGEKRDER